MSDPDRYKSRGRKERTPEQLKVLAMAREKARLVIAERTKIKREMEAPPEPEPAEAEPLAELPAEVSLTLEEIQTLIHSTLDQRRPPERRYTLVDGMYVKIK